MRSQTTLPSTQEMREETLKRFDHYIVTQVHRLGCSYSAVLHSPVPDLEIDELIQCVRIKFWQALAKREILYPPVYIKLIIRSELVNMVRRQKPLVPLPDNEEHIHSEVGIAENRCALDPADEVEQREEASACLKEAVLAALALPPRQRFAMICTLRDRVDDLTQLIETFKAYRVDIEAIRWPTNKAEKQLLQASLVPARKAIAKTMSQRGFRVFMPA